MPYIEDLAHETLMDEVMNDDPARERDYRDEVDAYLDDLEARYALNIDTDEPCA